MFILFSRSNFERYFKFFSTNSVDVQLGDVELGDPDPDIRSLEMVFCRPPTKAERGSLYIYIPNIFRYQRFSHQKLI